VVADPETNIVNIDLPAQVAERAVALAKERGLLLGMMLPTRLRVVFHLDIDRHAALAAARALAGALDLVCA
jgi:hypothetical protein